MSALPPKANIAESDWHVRVVPKADIAWLRTDASNGRYRLPDLRVLRGEIVLMDVRFGGNRCRMNRRGGNRPCRGFGNGTAQQLGDASVAPIVHMQTVG